MELFVRRIFLNLIIFFLIFQISSANAKELDRTQIGIAEGQKYNGYVVFLHINQSGTKGIFGQNLEDISIGDYTSSTTITNLDNDSGEIRFSHTNYGLPGWAATYNLDRFCTESVYTDWDYWRDQHEPTMQNEDFSENIIETEEYYGFIFQGRGSQTSADGITTPLTSRQDCIYNKQTGFREFFGLYEETYYSDHVEVIHQAEQFISSTEINKVSNASLYLELVSNIKPLMPSVVESNTDQIISDTFNSIKTSEEDSSDLTVNYPFWISFTTIGIFLILRRVKQ